MSGNGVSCLPSVFVTWILGFWVSPYVIAFKILLWNRSIFAKLCCNRVAFKLQKVVPELVPIEKYPFLPVRVLLGIVLRSF